MKRVWINSLLILACVLTLAGIGCQEGPQAVAKTGTDGDKYGVTRGTFRHRWWNFEERGRSFSRGGYYDEAIGDLKAAVRMRYKDHHRARTYGMHFVRYYPHRELGVAYLKKGDYDLAMTELKLSLAQAPTAKAHFYLHDATKLYLAKSKVDKKPPEIQLGKAPENGAASVRYHLEGALTDDYYLDRLYVNHREVEIPKALSNYDFVELVKLKKDKNSFNVKAVDLSGKHQIRIISVLQDITGPMLSVKEPRLGTVLDKDTITVRGVIVDPAGVEMLNIGGKDVQFEKDKTYTPFMVTLTIKQGRNMARFRAMDRAGNVTVGRLPFQYGDSDSLAFQPPLDAGDEDMLMAWGADAYRGGAVFGPAKGAPDVQILNLKSGQVVPLRPQNVDEANGGTYVFPVAVSGEQTISSITVNDRKVDVPEMPNLFFTQRVPMPVGDVKVKVIARDKDGRDGVTTVTVRGEVPKILDTEHRLTLAPLPFKNALEKDARIKTMVMDGKLTKSFVDARRFRLVDRSDDALKKFMDEQRLAKTDFVDKEKAIKTGKLLNAEFLLMGAIVEDQNGAEVLVKIVNVETSEIVATPQVYGMAKSLADIQKLASDMADAVQQALPLVSGKVKVKGDKIAIDHGLSAGLKSNTKVIIFRPDPDFGDEAPPTEIAIADILKVGKSLSFIQSKKILAEGLSIKDGDEFVTK